MAKSTSNMELVPQEVLNELKALDSQLDTTKNNLKELLTPVVSISNELQKSAKNYKDLTELINAFNKVEGTANEHLGKHRKHLTEIQKLQQKVVALNSAEAKEIAGLKETIRQKNQELKTSAQLTAANANSMKEMRLRLAEMTKEWASVDVGSERFKILTQEIANLDAEVKKNEFAKGDFRRNVGNYASGFDMLRYNVQQVARELPSLTIGLGQFFLAISNNVPMLVDEINRAKAANKTLREEGGKGVPVWKQLASSIFSWQTALVVGITVLSAYGKEITSFFKSLQNVQEPLLETSEIYKNFGQNIAKDSVELNILFGKLRNITKGTGEYNNARMQIINKYGEYLKGQENEIRNLENLDAAYQSLSKSVMQNSIQKGFDESIEKALNKYTEGVDKALEEFENIFKNKFGEEGITKLLQFKIGITSDNEELRSQAEEIYEQFNNTRYVEQQVTPSGEIIEGYYQTFNVLDEGKAVVEKLNEEFKQTEKSIVSMQNSFNKTYGIDAQESNSLIKKQQDLRKEAELLPESTEKEIKLKNKRLKQIDDEITRLKNLGIETDEQAKSREREEEKISNYIKRLSEKELDAQNKALALKEKNGAEANKRIVQDDRKSYEERIEALNNYTSALQASVHANADAQVDKLIRGTAIELGKDPDNEKDRAEVAKMVSNQIILIRLKEAQEKEKIAASSADMQNKIEEDRIRKELLRIKNEADLRNQEISGKESQEYSYLAEDYSKGLIPQEVYEAKKLAISQQYAQERYETEKKMLQDQLNLAGLTEEEELEIKKRLADADAEYTKYVNDQKIASAEKLAEKQQELAQATYEFMDQLVNQHFENQLKKLEEEAEANEEWTQNEMDRIGRLEESGAISKEQAEARKKAVDDQAQAREAQIEKEKKEILRKQAIYQRAMSIAQVSWSTAQGIMNIWAQMPPYIAPAMTAVVAALGAVQIASILATPIPEYAKGTEDHPGGLAIVGDGGKSEMIIANGQIFKTPSTDTLVDLPKHSIVLPDFKAEIGAMKAPDIPVVDRVISFEELSTLLKEGNQKTDTLVKMLRQNAKNEIYERELNKIKRISR